MNNFKVVVLIGEQTKQCVKINAIGGAQDRRGASGFIGINTVASDYIIRDGSGRQAGWNDANRVFFYSAYEWQNNYPINLQQKWSE